MFPAVRFNSLLATVALIVVLQVTCMISLAQDCVSCPNSAGVGVIPPFSTESISNDLVPQITLSPSDTQTWVMRKLVNEVTVLFSVTNKGKFVGDLGLQDIEVRDDKKPPSAIVDFRTEKDLPLRLALLIDISDSVTERFEFEQKAATRFLQQVVRHNMDQAFVMGFNGRTEVTQEFSDDAQLLARGVERLQAGGNTALYDAIYSACEKLARTPESGTVARVIVLLTDGEDTASHRSYAAAVDMAERSGVTIFGVSTNKIDQSLPGDVKLKGLAEETGGKTIFPGEANALAKAFSKVEQEIRSRYAVSYRPAAFEPNGHYRKIRIVAHRPGKKFRVNARRGYYARLDNAFR